MHGQRKVSRADRRKGSHTGGERRLFRKVPCGLSSKTHVSRGATTKSRAPLFYFSYTLEPIKLTYPELTIVSSGYVLILLYYKHFHVMLVLFICPVVEFKRLSFGKSARTGWKFTSRLYLQRDNKS